MTGLARVIVTCESDDREHVIALYYSAAIVKNGTVAGGRDMFYHAVL